jgi:hypothetical protein|nr:MAG TPA: Minor Head Virion Protein G6P [Inoviridae sp.]
MKLALIPLIALLLNHLIIRIIIATGITFVSYSGYSIALSKFKSYISNALNSMPADIYNLLLIAGVGQGMNYLFGAFAFWIAMRMLNKLTFRK